jgi:hypothetical protein
MKVLNKDKLSSTGRLMMIYGPTGVGKTVSLIQTSPKPIMWIQTEARSLVPSIEAAGRDDLDLDIAIYEDWEQLMEFIAKPDNFQRHKTVVVDSFSHLMSIGLSMQIEDQAFEARSEKEKAVKSLTSKTKLSQEGFGTLSSWMFRLTAALGRLSQLGKLVIVTALLQETPKWNRELSAAPALKGREFPVNMPGFFDLIGMVEPRADPDGNIIYPPRVSFESPDGSFVAKYSGAGNKRQGPLNIKKIIKRS